MKLLLTLICFVSLSAFADETTTDCIATNESREVIVKDGKPKTKTASQGASVQ